MVPLSLQFGAVPLQFGIPGGPELLIIFLLFFIVALPAVVLVGLAILLLKRNSGDDDRVQKLEREVRTLRERVDELEE